ncbi:MAG: CoB--CoM heterodisulfide reductase iron-sulfur subunit A family protein [Chloroflexi bacterium]|nr:CoB--CoM heterodisulfide reductase iron-sulfur subunit A family protein [Chloroflexota bacterium]
MASADIVVVGGGMAGLSAALEAAECGYSVALLEKEPFLGGRVMRMHRFFPKLCPPTCGLELYFRRLKTNPRVQYYTQATVQNVRGGRGAFMVDVLQSPRFVATDKCTACGECLAVCPAERSDDFNYGLGRTNAIYLPHQMAMPNKYAIDSAACLGQSCAKCVAVCPYGAIDLAEKPQTFALAAKSIVLASGWQPYDGDNLAESLGYGRLPGVVNNVTFERLAAGEGPTGGKLLRPGDGKEIQSIAFVQCAGSRDENHLPYCSAVCCLGSLKQATYVRERVPSAQVHVFFIDARCPGRYEDFYRKVAADPLVKTWRGKVAKVTRDEGTGALTVEADDSLTGHKTRATVDMVVLATGTDPAPARQALPGLGLAFDAFGFVLPDGLPGVHPAGVAKHPMDVAQSVRDGTGAALRAIQDVVGG